MKFTLSWLKEYLDTEAGADEVAAKLTAIGIEVESVVDRSKGLEDFVVAHVLSAVQHPNADRLKACTVDFGEGPISVVCGAINARAGMKAVLARPGQYVPGIQVTLKKASIRGVESNGMMLSEDEMGLGSDHSGIIELPADAPIGVRAVDVMGLSDPVFDVSITPNRGDCLGVRGIARDLAAAGLGRLKPLDAAPVPGGFRSPIDVILDFPEDKRNACPYFVGRYIRGVRNGESPRWVKERLAAIGLRPISALVDVTNLLTVGLNRPLHVFDADKVRGHIRPRLARPGEVLNALNGKAYELDGEMTVIADDEAPEALGGIMGGERSGCTEDTVNVFVESAYFDALRTAATGRRLNLQSDARFRFERGVDPAFLIDGIEIATRLILEWCGGEASDVVVAGAEPDWRRDIELRPERALTLGGVDLATADIERILAGLGFGLRETADRPTVSVPSWRGDIVGEPCLVEEVLRIHGYEHIPVVPLQPTTSLPHPAWTPEQKRRAVARRTLAARGMVEAVTLSFLPAATAALFGGGAEAVRLTNPISSDLDLMRPSLLPNLIAAAGRNADRGIADAALFEVGPQFAGDKPEDETVPATGIRAGRRIPRNWAEAARAVDVFDAKADALAVLAAAGAPVDNLQAAADAPAWYHPGRSGSLRLGPKVVLAWFGEIHPGVLAGMDVRGPVVGFEAFIDRIPAPKRRKGAAKPHLVLSPFQPVERDFAFVVAAEVPAADVLKAARSAQPDLIAEVRVFDVFAGGALEAGKKSLAINVVLQPREKTLTDQEIEAVAAQIVSRVEKATGGSLRT
ncbi:MAG: phenylalanine--tRNA ligase subunit beta [Rhodospirillales bacterium]|jgi:phenylalanyl-tRNA synthetase beta chain|nr:phenylalanine--tRNA ligase subunit beta [Rhodospirillales bacterium]